LDRQQIELADEDHLAQHLDEVGRVRRHAIPPRQSYPRSASAYSYQLRLSVTFAAFGPALPGSTYTVCPGRLTGLSSNRSRSQSPLAPCSGAAQLLVPLSPPPIDGMWCWSAKTQSSAGAFSWSNIRHTSSSGPRGSYSPTASSVGHVILSR